MASAVVRPSGKSVQAMSSFLVRTSVVDDLVWLQIVYYRHIRLRLRFLHGWAFPGLHFQGAPENRADRDVLWWVLRFGSRVARDLEPSGGR